MQPLVKRFNTAVVVLLSLSSLVCGQPKTITILHTNDIHASFLPHEAFWIKSDSKPMVGGMEELSWMIDSLRKAQGTTLLLDGGDVMTGTPISEFDYKGAAGGALFEMMNLIGYDAWTIGNHDLDISQDNLKKLTAIARFPTVTANLTDSLNQFVFGNKQYVVVERGGLRIGIIGHITRDLFHVTNTNNLKGLNVREPWAITQKLIDEIDQKTDLIIALTHEGVDDDSILAQSVHGLDVIIGGHSHTRLTKPKVVNNVIICQAGSNCENLGELSLTVEGDSVTHFEGKLLPLWVRHTYSNDQLTALVTEFKKKIDDEYGQVLGTLVSDWKRSSSGESSIGDFIADAMREGAKADVAVTNSSGIRKDLSAGPIRKLDLFEIAPFRNVLCTFTFTGKELHAFAQRYAKELAGGKASIQISGMTCTWQSTGDGGVEVVNVKVGGKDVVDEGTYTIATSDFVVNQGEKYIGVIPSGVSYTQTTMFQSLVAKVEHDKTIAPMTAKRFQQIQH
ncbi:MAG: bifunctional metallophosphatase/5'-nucleotidase [Ignavibacteriae bacterium]|nr:bifunctional metallophosphatase/5'-nucleotidase [Ignavibacteria bacterium]MBI3364872.1 bifunctional metallophosphatase/5'-nucleotidase [Ignavibacteriota bacterium]